eukprot:7298042-Heterocapsa_arctica.AAC.1
MLFETADKDKENGHVVLNSVKDDVEDSEKDSEKDEISGEEKHEVYITKEYAQTTEGPTTDWAE